jgi:hypothetical protein
MTMGMCLVAMTVGACGGEADRLGTGENYSVRGALAELPASVDDGEMTIFSADLEAATRLSGLERPRSLDDGLLEWVGQLTGGSTDGAPAPVFIPLAEVFNPAQLAEHDEFEAELGWSLLDSNAFVEEVSSPRTFAVVEGDFGQDPVNPELLSVADGVVSAGEGEDLAVDAERRTVARPLGAPLRLAQQGSRIAAGTSTDEVAEWGAGPEETLADDEALASVAAALDEADVVSAVVVSGVTMDLGSAVGEGAPPAVIEDYGDLVPSAAFEDVGIGWGADDEGAAEATIAFRFADSEAAAAALPVFERQFAEGQLIQSRQPLDEQLRLERAESDGPVAVLSLSVLDGTPPGLLLDLLHRRDLPFVHQ